MATSIFDGRNATDRDFSDNLHGDYKEQMSARGPVRPHVEPQTASRFAERSVWLVLQVWPDGYRELVGVFAQWHDASAMVCAQANAADYVIVEEPVL